MKNIYGMNVIQVLISGPDYYRAPDNPKVLVPVRGTRVILENGAMFKRSFGALSLKESFVSDNFDKEADQWEKIEQEG